MGKRHKRPENWKRETNSMTGETNQDNHKDRKQSMTREHETYKIKTGNSWTKMKTMTPDDKLV